MLKAIKKPTTRATLRLNCGEADSNIRFSIVILFLPGTHRAGLLTTRRRSDRRACAADFAMTGRSPGSRVILRSSDLPGFPVALWTAVAAYSCGGSHGSGPNWVIPTVFPINPAGLACLEPVAETIAPGRGVVQPDCDLCSARNGNPVLAGNRASPPKARRHQASRSWTIGMTLVPYSSTERISWSWGIGPEEYFMSKRPRPRSRAVAAIFLATVSGEPT